MRKFTNLVLAFTILLCCNWAEAQNIQAKKPVNKHSLLALIVKEKLAGNNRSTFRSKKETQKKLASYTYIDIDTETGEFTDTSEKYIFTWGSNGLPTQLLVTGNSDFLIEDKTVPFRLTYTNFTKVTSESDLKWFNPDFDFEAKNGILEVYDNGMWQNLSKNEKTVSASGMVQEFRSYKWLSGAWANQNKETYTYDTKGRRTESLEQEWDGTKWVNKTRWMDFYDEDGRNTGYQQDAWEGNEWIAKFGSKITFSKNSNDQIITAVTEQVDETGAWMATGRQTYEWNSAGELVKATEQQFFNGEWTNMAEYRDIKWKLFDANTIWSYPILIGGYDILSYDSYYYNSFDSTWTLNTHFKNIFSGNNIVESLNMQSNGTETDTMNRTTYTYYANGDMKESKNWYKNSGEWTVQFGYGNNNTYDNDGDITKNIGLTWDADSGKFIEQYMQLYSYTNVTVGIAKTNEVLSGINVYPNPVSGGNITLSLPSSATAYISVFDNTGRIVKQMQSNSKNTQIDLSNFSAGVYMVNVNQAGKISNVKLLVK